MVSLTGKQSPVIEIITSASTAGDESFKEYRNALAELGIENVGHIHHNNREEVLTNGMTGRIEKADAVFLAGGDQLKYTSRYGGTPFLTALRKDTFTVK